MSYSRDQNRQKMACEARFLGKSRLESLFLKRVPCPHCKTTQYVREYSNLLHFFFAKREVNLSLAPEIPNNGKLGYGLLNSS